jgi:hypothetical protein
MAVKVMIDRQFCLAVRCFPPLVDEEYLIAPLPDAVQMIPSVRRADVRLQLLRSFPLKRDRWPLMGDIMIGNLQG